MHQQGFKFSPEEFNTLFPFYLLFDKELTILSVGKSLEKLVPDLPGKKIADWIYIQRPTVLLPEFESLKNLGDQFMVWQCGTGDKITNFRGQLKWFEDENQFLLLGSPWFESVDQLVERQLSIRDFAFHDPLIDLLHVLKNQEINSNELKELLQKINNQKNELKVAAKAVQDMSLFPMQNPDPLIRLDESGNILLMNPAAKTLQQVNYQGVSYSFQDFWKMICPQINKESDRWLVEAMVNNQSFSFLCKYLSEPKFFNIYGRNITEEKAGQEEIKRLSLVASSNENGVLFIEPDGKIIWANRVTQGNFTPRSSQNRA